MLFKLAFLFFTHLLWLLLEEKDNNPFQSSESNLILKTLTSQDKQNSNINDQLPCWLCAVTKDVKGKTRKQGILIFISTIMLDRV